MSAVRLDYGMPLEEAERWCDAWDVEATPRCLAKDGDHWTVGAAWIAEQRAARRRPCGT